MTTQWAPDTAESASALVDGQLPGEAAAPALDWLCQTPEGRLHWQTCHMVGEVLRSGQASSPARDAAFLHRLQARLALEAVAGSPPFAPDSIADQSVTTGVSAPFVSVPAAANDALFRWRLVAGVAALALVALIGWQSRDAAGPLLAVQAPEAGPIAAPSATAPLETAALGDAPTPLRMLRDPQLDALLAAHKQLGGGSALPMPAGFLRNATFEGSGR